jgi:transcriptional regulator GlxA family with amidase domain
VQDAITQQTQYEWTVPRMAEVAHVSARHLTRLFNLHAEIAPLAYLRRVRLTVAHRALQAGHGVRQAAELSGFGSDTQLRRAWHRFGVAGAPSHTRGSATPAASSRPAAPAR